MNIMFITVTSGRRQCRKRDASVGVQRRRHRGVEEEVSASGRGGGAGMRWPKEGAGVEPRRGTYQEAADIKVQRRSGHAVTP
jgi:hypothetical protein